jgi:hypothetical protein
MKKATLGAMIGSLAIGVVLAFTLAVPASANPWSGETLTDIGNSSEQMSGECDMESMNGMHGNHGDMHRDGHMGDMHREMGPGMMHGNHGEMHRDGQMGDMHRQCDPDMMARETRPMERDRSMGNMHGERGSGITHGMVDRGPR